MLIAIAKKYLTFTLTSHCALCCSALGMPNGLPATHPTTYSTFCVCQGHLMWLTVTSRFFISNNAKGCFPKLSVVRGPPAAASGSSCDCGGSGSWQGWPSSVNRPVFVWAVSPRVTLQGPQQTLNTGHPGIRSRFETQAELSVATS